MMTTEEGSVIPVDVGSAYAHVDDGFVRMLPSALASAITALLDGDADAAADMLPTSTGGRIVAAVAALILLLLLLVDVREELIAVVQRRFNRRTKTRTTNAEPIAANTAVTQRTNTRTPPPPIPAPIPIPIPTPTPIPHPTAAATMSSPSILASSVVSLPSVIPPPSPLPLPTSPSVLSADAYAVSEHVLCALIRGVQLIKYSRHDVHSMRTIKVDKSDGHLLFSWQSGSVLLSDIIDVVDGKHTATFLKPHNNAIANDAATCFSVVTRNRSVDLQTVSAAQRNEYANALRALTNTMRKRSQMNAEAATPKSATPPHRRTLSVSSPRPLDAHQSALLRLMTAAIDKHRNDAT